MANMDGVAEAKMPDQMAKPLSPKRICAAMIAFLGWFAICVQFYFNVTEALANNEAVSGHLVQFFSYFTIETNILVAASITIVAARPQAEQYLARPSVKSALVVYIIIVGIVYTALLRNLWNPQGMRLVADTVLHDVIPILYPLFWLVFLPKGSLRWADPAFWLIYPTLFFVYSMLRGMAFGVYPYPFIDAGKLGFERVSLNALAFLAVFFGFGVILTAIDRALAPDARGRSRLGRAAEL
jgi:hypothetical protein